MDDSNEREKLYYNRELLVEINILASALSRWFSRWSHVRKYIVLNFIFWYAK